MKKLILLSLCFMLGLSAIAQSTGAISVQYKDSYGNQWPVTIPTSIRNSDSATVSQGFQSNYTYTWPGYASDSFVTHSSYTSKLITINYFACGSWHKLDTAFNTSNYYLGVTIVLPCDPPCNAQFSHTVQNGQNFTFIPKQVINGYTHHWSFGNGATSTLTQPSYVYFTAGTYDITHIVTNSQLGCSDTFSYSIGIYIPCNADFNYSGKEKTVDYKSRYHLSGWSHIWNFGDGSSSNSVNPTHTYSQYGVYTVAHQVSGNGCFNTKYYTVYVNNNCEAKFGLVPDSNNINASISLDSSTYNSSYYTRFNWNTEGRDYSTSNGSYSHYFNTPGVKTVQLILQNGTCIDTTERTDSVGMDCARKPRISVTQYYAPYGRDYSIGVDNRDRLY